MLRSRAVVETMVHQLVAVGPVVDKRRDVPKTSDGKDVSLPFSQPVFIGFLNRAVSNVEQRDVFEYETNLF